MRFSTFWLAFWKGVSFLFPDFFIKKWIVFWKGVGYSLPSSPFLIRRMLSYIDWNKKIENIVELGGGNGMMTRALIKRKGDRTRLTSCEIEKDRFDTLKSLENNYVHILNIDAKKCLDSFPQNSLDLIISTLPLGSLGKEISRDILRSASRALSDDGLFMQYQYFASNKKDVEEFFDIINVDWEFLNIPPAFIYICKKKR